MGDRGRGEEAPGVNVQENNDLAHRLEEIDNLGKQVESLKLLNSRQETAIAVMRERIFELEMDLVNARCSVFELEQHTH